MLTETDFVKVTFTKSISRLEQSPENKMPEIAFAGRSNVGKSSLLNAIFQRKNYVKTSSTPGKTQLINYFNIADKIYCVDLPGYGFAKIPKAQKGNWKKMIETYITKNDYLKKVYVLIDSRHDLMQNDSEMIKWLEYMNIDYAIVLSKMDKLPKREQTSSISKYRAHFNKKEVIPFSIKNDQYIKNLKNYIIRDIS